MAVDIKNTRTYKEIIQEARTNINKLHALNIEVPTGSWFFDALVQAELAEQQRLFGNLEDYTSNPLNRLKTTTAYGNLSEINFIISEIDRLVETSGHVVKKKINDVLRMPLRMLDESSDTGTNMGRNILFELRLAARFVRAGYSPVLNVAHPDIFIPTSGFNYAIECKRVFSAKKFEDLTSRAIDQLEKNSLGENNWLGIVAISITRHFHGGDKKLYGESSDRISEFADKETDRFIKEKLPFIHRKFPTNIPCLILDFSDLAESDIPYWIHFLSIVETSNDSAASKYQFVLKDLAALKTNQT